MNRSRSMHACLSDIRKVFRCLILLIAGFGCHYSWASSTALADEGIPSPPFASGVIDDLSWSLRINRAQCHHEQHPSTWCTLSDQARVNQESGIESTLLQWVHDPQTQSVLISYFTLTSRPIAEALCMEAKA